MNFQHEVEFHPSPAFSKAGDGRNSYQTHKLFLYNITNGWCLAENTKHQPFLYKIKLCRPICK